jgi:hypothetical protein
MRLLVASARISYLRRRQGRAVGAIVAVVGPALLATACGGSSGSHVARLGSTGTTGVTSSSATSTANGAAAFSRCVRSHGVPAYPDPGGDGLLPKKTPQEVGVSPAKLQAALGACIHLVPNGGRPTQAQIAAYRSTMLRYARCIRVHGVANMPDPNARGHLDIGPGTGVDVNGPAFQAAYRACKKDLSP